MFRFTYTIIREPQPALSKNYNAGSSVPVVIAVFSVMAAYAYTYTGTSIVILAKRCLWLPDDGWSIFYDFNCFNSSTV
jgi:hypothetical protein